MYKIIFIDESKDEIDSFLDYADRQNLNDDIEIKWIYPCEDIKSTIDKILYEHEADAIISDFMLNEYKEDISYNVPFNGVDLVEGVQKIKKKFPCFVMTSYDQNAVGASSDVNIVYIKRLLHENIEQETGVKISFIGKVVEQIKHYKKKISNSQNRLNELITKANNKLLNAKEEAELLDLDNFLESALNHETRIVPQLKNKSTLNDLHKLIENTDTLLKKMDNIDG